MNCLLANAEFTGRSLQNVCRNFHRISNKVSMAGNEKRAVCIVHSASFSIYIILYLELYTRFMDNVTYFTYPCLKITYAYVCCMTVVQVINFRVAKNENFFPTGFQKVCFWSRRKNIG